MLKRIWVWLESRDIKTTPYSGFEYSRIESGFNLQVGIYRVVYCCWLRSESSWSVGLAFKSAVWFGCQLGCQFGGGSPNKSLQLTPRSLFFIEAKARLPFRLCDLAPCATELKR